MNSNYNHNNNLRTLLEEGGEAPLLVLVLALPLGLPGLVIRSLLLGLRLGARVREATEAAPAGRAQSVADQKILSRGPGQLAAPGEPRLGRLPRLEAKLGEALPKCLPIRLLAQHPEGALGGTPQPLQAGLVATEERAATCA